MTQNIDITAVVAMTPDRVIGRDGGLPWPRLPADLAHLKACSIGRPNIMGRKVFDSIGRKPLPARANIVLTRQAGLDVPAGVLLAHSPEQALELACAELDKTEQLSDEGRPEIVILGGAEVYGLYLDDLSRVEQTLVHTQLEGDTFMPELKGKWEVVAEEFRPRDEANPFDLTFQTLVRRG